MTLEIMPKTVYGRTLLYPLNDIAKTFCSLLGVKTLSLEQLEKIKRLGVEIKVSTQDLTKGML